MYKVIVTEKYPQCKIIDEKEKRCLALLPISQQQKAQNICDALTAVEIYGKNIAELIDERNKAVNDLKYAKDALRSIENIYDWIENAAGKIAHGTLSYLDFKH